jgi:hypothetical protein
VPTRRSITAVCVALALGAAPPAAAHGDDEARVEAACGRGAAAQMRLKADDGRIRVEFELDSRRGRERWRVTLVHERRVEWRGTARTRRGSRSFRIRRSIHDYDGVDEVSVHASGPGGNACHAIAKLTA